MDPVLLSRILFAVTAQVHFMFVPLTLGLSFLVALMETAYVRTLDPLYKDMTKFWGKLLMINFAVGVATGIPLEFQFGTNWASFSLFVGDIFGAPIAIEGMVAFFLESTFMGLFIFGWDKLSKRQHLTATWCVAIGGSLSALWILIANAWMQHPVGSTFNPLTMRYEVTNFFDLILNPVAQGKFAHTTSAGFVTSAMFVLSVSAYHLLKHQHVRLFKYSFALASAFGLCAVVISGLSGDESAYRVAKYQPQKLAAVEALWHTETDPGLSLLTIPDPLEDRNLINLTFPKALGLLANRHLHEEVKGVIELREEALTHIRSGQKALGLLQKIRQKTASEEEFARFLTLQSDLGYGLLLWAYTPDPVHADEVILTQAARDIVPNVLASYLLFHAMLGLFLLFLVLFGLTTYLSAKNKIESHPFLLKLILFALPLPWIANAAGWMVAEYGRQPWAIFGLLPTHYAASDLSPWNIAASILLIGGLGLFLVAVWAALLARYAKRGPSSSPQLTIATDRN